MSVKHAEGAETYALGDNRTHLDDVYDFNPQIESANIAIVSGRSGGQAIRFTGVNGNDSKCMALNIGGLTSDATTIRGFAYKPAALPDSRRYLMLWEDEDNRALCCYVLKTDGAIEFRRGGINGTLIATSSAGVITGAVWQYCEGKVTLHDSTGAYEFRVTTDDGTVTSVLSGSGVDTTAQGTRAYQIWLGMDLGNPPDAWDFDDLVLVDAQVGTTGNEHVDFIGDVEALRTAPNGNYVNNWTPSSAVDHYTLINEDGEDGETSTLSSGTPAQIEKNDYENIPTNRLVAFVAARPVMRKTDSGTRTIKLNAESNGTTITSDAYYVSTDFRRYSQIWETDPDTDEMWGPAAFNAAKFGAECGNP